MAEYSEKEIEQAREDLLSSMRMYLKVNSGIDDDWFITSAVVSLGLRSLSTHDESYQATCVEGSAAEAMGLANYATMVLTNALAGGMR